jgi:hypothetical protein
MSYSEYYTGTNLINLVKHYIKPAERENDMERRKLWVAVSVRLLHAFVCIGVSLKPSSHVWKLASCWKTALNKLRNP